jgi:hypothetical protein
MPLALGAGTLIARGLTYNSQVCCADSAISGSESFMAENKTKANTGERPVSLHPQDFI